MAHIHIGRGTTNLGAFTEEEVIEGLRSGRFLQTDLCWREGMTAWKPLSEFPEFKTEPALLPTASAGIPPFGEASGEPEPPESGERQGLPWDNRQSLGFVNAFIETMKLVLTDPSRAFSSMKREGGLGEPLIFGVAGGWAGGVVALLYQFIASFAMHGASLGLAQTNARGLSPMMFTGAVGGATLFGAAIFFPIFLCIGIFIGSAITHLCLMLLGAAKQPFETTFRVACFSIGATALLQVIPLCGGYISGIWNLVTQCIGLAKSHEISTSKAVAAVLLPVIVCCGFILLIAGSVAMLSFARAHH